MTLSTITINRGEKVDPFAAAYVRDGATTCRFHKIMPPATVSRPLFVRVEGRR